MMSKKDTFLNNKGKRVLFVVVAFFLLYLVIYVIDPYSPQWQGYFDRPLSEMLTEWSISLITCLLISESSIAISSTLNKYIQWTDHPLRRLAVETGLNIIAAAIINLLVSLFCFYSDDGSSSSVLSPEEARGMIQWLVVSVIISFMIMGVNVGNYLISNWKNEALRVAELNQLATESELQSLKLQIDPHFVFNNLSVLSELILENQQQGYEYAENFSRIYRYMLVNSKKDVISLEDELKFLDSYMFLIKHRFGEAVLFEISVSQEHRNLYTAPLTLQLLVENALKHNKTNKKNPLKIRIYSSSNNELVVENKLLPLEKTIDSSGIGIRNIIRRYNLLSQQAPEVIQDEISFKVIIPLIKP